MFAFFDAPSSHLYVEGHFHSATHLFLVQVAVVIGFNVFMQCSVGAIESGAEVVEVLW